MNPNLSAQCDWFFTFILLVITSTNSESFYVHSCSDLEILDDLISYF